MDDGSQNRGEMLHRNYIADILIYGLLFLQLYQMLSMCFRLYSSI